MHKVEALQKVGAKITLGGMLSLLIYEGGARLAHYNTLCSENDYDKSSNCGDHPEARYSYQLGLGAVHTSNFHPCKDRPWTGLQRAKFVQIAAQAGFSPTAAQIASVAAELHAFCPASTQPQAVDFYILRAHDLGIPKDGKGNELTLAGKYPFFASRISLAFFFSSLDAQPSQLTSDEKAISIWGRTAYYNRPDVQAAILAGWNTFRARYAGGSQPVPSSKEQRLPSVHKLQNGDYALDLSYAQRSAVDAFLSKNPAMQLVTSNIASLTVQGHQLIQDQVSASMKSGEMQFPFASWHDFNADGQLDLALVFVSRSTVNSYKWREWWIVVFEGTRQGDYKPNVVTKFQGGCLDGLTYRESANSVQFSCFGVAAGSFHWNGHTYEVTPLKGD